MAGTISVDLDSAGEQGHSGEYGPYPFNPHTAFQSLAPKVEEIQDKEGSGKKRSHFRKVKEPDAIMQCLRSILGFNH
jgi:hypothetical protein